MASLTTTLRWSLAALIVAAPLLPAQETMTDREEIVHVLNRIGYGPRPGDVEAVQKMGLQTYIQQQLHPESIDDSAVEKKLASFEFLQMSAPDLAGLYQTELKNGIKLQKEIADLKAQADAAKAADPNASMPDMREQLRKKLMADNPNGLKDMQKQARAASAFVQLEQAKIIRAIESPRQLQEVLVDFWGNHFNIDVKKGPDRVLKITDDREVIRPHILGKFRDLLGASAKSPAMLFYLDNAQSSVSREVSPFMQEMMAARYEKAKKDGQNLPPPPVDLPKPGETPKTKQMGGINENYAREIMELHTLGVDGGYTQQDITEVARCFTGWSISRESGTFIYRPMMHDNGAKVVLGHQIPAGGGMKDGEMVLDILASHPATAHHLALEMCTRFVSDEPPAVLVDRVAEVFTKTDGDLRKVTEAIITSPEFLAPVNYNNKIKSPLEFAISAVRASNSTIATPVAQADTPGQFRPPGRSGIALEGAAILGRGQASDRMSSAPRQSLNYHVATLGQPLFACSPPTGYKETSQGWVSPGALIERLNFAMALTDQKLTDIRFDSKSILGNTDLDKPDAVLSQSVNVLLQDNVSPSTRKVLEQNALPADGESKTVNPNKLIALIIGSPEFQRK